MTASPRSEGCARTSYAKYSVTPETIEQASAAVARNAAQRGGTDISYLPTPSGLVLLAVAAGSRAEAVDLKSDQV